MTEINIPNEGEPNLSFMEASAMSEEDVKDIVVVAYCAEHPEADLDQVKVWADTPAWQKAREAWQEYMKNEDSITLARTEGRVVGFLRYKLDEASLKLKIKNLKILSNDSTDREEFLDGWKKYMRDRLS